jgi:hypothetical protein
MSGAIIRHFGEFVKKRLAVQNPQSLMSNWKFIGSAEEGKGRRVKYQEF